MSFEVPERYCSQHRQYSRSEGGAFVSTENGKNHRWFCAMCLKRREEWLRQAASPTPSTTEK